MGYRCYQIILCFYRKYNIISIEKKHEEVLFMKGRSIPVYVKGDMHAYNVLKHYGEQSGTSISEYIRRGMECAAMEQECNVQISPGAYFAMQDGRFDVLTRVHLSNGTMLISVSEEAYETKHCGLCYGNKVQLFLDKYKDGESDE